MRCHNISTMYPFLHARSIAKQETGNDKMGLPRRPIQDMEENQQDHQ
jgi:hypothetical protein